MKTADAVVEELEVIKLRKHSPAFKAKVILEAVK